MEPSRRLEVWDAIPRPFITPSLLNCDFARVGEEILALERAGAAALHLDVMDGHFVPNLSYGPPVVADWRKRATVPFDGHLMISDPARYLDDYVKAGCDTILFHIEAVPDPRDLAARIRAHGRRVGIALNPPTPLSAVEPFVDLADTILVMSVMPGFGGQAFHPEVLSKVSSLRSRWPKLNISIDGGIKPDTAALAVAAGVTQLVVGSATFRSDGDYGAALGEIAAGVRRGLALIAERGGEPVPKTGPTKPA